MYIKHLYDLDVIIRLITSISVVVYFVFGFNRGLPIAQGLFPDLGPPEENFVVKLTRYSSSGHSSAECTACII